MIPAEPNGSNITAYLIAKLLLLFALARQLAAQLAAHFSEYVIVGGLLAP